MWANLVTPLAGIVGNYMESRAAVSKAKVQAKVAKVEADAEISKRVAAGEIDIQKSQADATDGSWKDEFFSVILGFGSSETLPHS